MKSHLFGIFLLLAGAAAAQPTFDADTGFPIRLNDRVILSQQRVPSDAAHRIMRGERVLNLIGEWSRREWVAREQDRVEHSFEYRLPLDSGAHVYDLELPLLPSAVVRLTHGSQSDSPRHADWNSATPIGKRLDGVRFLQISDGETAYSIDVDPEGVWPDSNSFDHSLRTNSVTKTDVGLRLRYGRSARGEARLKGKIIVTLNPLRFEEAHPFARAGYKIPLATDRAIAFTSERFNKNFQITGIQEYRKGLGWTTRPPGMQLVQSGGPPGLHAGGVRASGSAVFRLSATPGHGFVTLMFGNRSAAVGPVTATINGRRCVEDLQLGAGRFASRHTAIDAAEGTIDVELTGPDWTLNGILYQPLITLNEDYQFTRGWWVESIDW